MYLFCLLTMKIMDTGPGHLVRALVPFSFGNSVDRISGRGSEVVKCTFPFCDGEMVKCPFTFCDGETVNSSFQFCNGEMVN